jgi:hypothetical protein
MIVFISIGADLEGAENARGGPMSDDDQKLVQLREEKKKAREDVYSLGVRFNAGETGVRADLDAAIRRSDELDVEIRRMTEVESEQPLKLHDLPPPLYGPPPVWSRWRRK